MVLGLQGFIWEWLQRELGAGSDMALGQGIPALVTGSWGSKEGPGGPQNWAEGAWGVPGRKGLGQCVTHGALVAAGRGQGRYQEEMEGVDLELPGIPGRAVGHPKDQRHLCWQGGAGCGFSDAGQG